MTLRLGLVGYPVDASLSPAMHTAALAALGIPGSYVRCAVAPDRLPEAWPQLVADLDGFNVTVPHKQAAATLVDTLTDEARLAGSVNTVIVEAQAGSRRTIGATTDGAGVAAAPTCWLVGPQAPGGGRDRRSRGQRLGGPASVTRIK